MIIVNLKIELRSIVIFLFILATANYICIAEEKGLPAAAVSEDLRTSKTAWSTTLPNGDNIKVYKRVEIAVDPNRDFHGVSACRVPNGDLLVTHKDSIRHTGGDSVIRQWRSTDGGLTWQNEGIIADWRQQGYDLIMGELGVTPDNRLVLLAQTYEAAASGNIGSCWNRWYISSDNGRTWEYKGIIDQSDKYAVKSPRSVFSHKGIMYFSAYSTVDGMALYVSTDNGDSWRRRSVIFPRSYPDFLPGAKKDDYGPFYPHTIVLPDGEFLAMTYLLGGMKKGGCQLLALITAVAVLTRERHGDL